MIRNINTYRLTFFNMLLLFAFLFIGGLYFARKLLVPLMFAALLAMLLLPLARKLQSWKVPKGLSIVLAMLVMIVIIAGGLTLVSNQILGFTEDLPQIQEKISRSLLNFQHFIERHTGVSPESQVRILRQRSETFLDAGGTYMRQLFLGTTGLLANLSIIMIFIFFFLYYRHKFRRFILKLTKDEHSEKTTNVITEISQITQKYLSGVLLVILVLAILNAIGLLIIGIKHAVFFACLAAILNIIPYIGTFIGSTLPVLYALLVYDTLTPAIATVLLFLGIQALEGNILTPNIVGSKVKINPLAAVFALLVGGFIWGIAGMILFLPLLGIAKIIFDNVHSLEPYAYLIGEDEAETKDESQSLMKKLWNKWRKKK